MASYWGNSVPDPVAICPCCLVRTRHYCKSNSTHLAIYIRRGSCFRLLGFCRVCLPQKVILKIPFRNISRNEIKHYLHPSFILLGYRPRDVSNMEVHEIQSKINSHEEKIEAALTRLKAMKSNVAELRTRCELLKKHRSDVRKTRKVCSECDREIVQDQEIVVKDNFGNPIGHYHKGCFAAIWCSQTWRFDYSSDGFLKRSEKKSTNQ